MEVYYNEYFISDDKSKIDYDVVIGYLQRSYWASKRSPERIKQSIDHSKCIGVYLGDLQIGFARIITDEATMFYLCDVFILEEYQGKGIGKKLIETIVHAEEYEWMTGILGTLDAHGLYEQFGFVKDSERLMRRTAQGRDT
ncbi:GNAT family N-acetyltransferase [Paenibacillus abyssi]|uniref:N-acetyltransferase n=1 Tax=Paenibacillus abyssi TaxID=1340531 RepID=A0A917FZG0_9BACL|nr:GNAT family N-acetyltransferase [Paenibacillus abyssi]GGG15212.1 N-acetyltransferase [Paenibacillus abyssi]